jgi:hypothetical protein
VSGASDQSTGGHRPKLRPSPCWVPHRPPPTSPDSGGIGMPPRLYLPPAATPQPRAPTRMTAWPAGTSRTRPVESAGSSLAGDSRHTLVMPRRHVGAPFISADTIEMACGSPAYPCTRISALPRCADTTRRSDASASERTWAPSENDLTFWLPLRTTQAEPNRHSAANEPQDGHVDDPAFDHLPPAGIRDTLSVPNHVLVPARSGFIGSASAAANPYLALAARMLSRMSAGLLRVNVCL